MKRIRSVSILGPIEDLCVEAGIICDSAIHCEDGEERIMASVREYQKTYSIEKEQEIENGVRTYERS